MRSFLVLFLTVLAITTVLAFPQNQPKAKKVSEGPPPAPADLKRFKELVDKHTTKDADGKPVLDEEGKKEVLEGAESFYGHYGYYPSFGYPGFYPGYYPGFYGGFQPYPYYPHYGYGYGGYGGYGYPYWY